MVAIRAGELRHRITVETPDEAQDTFGEPVKTWKKLTSKRIWAKREDLSGRELFQAQQINAKVTTQFTIRHRTDIDARMRVLSDGVCYGIESVQDPDGRGVKTLLLCARTVNE